MHGCKHLGICQSRTPRCIGCDTGRPFPFAPGVLVGYRPSLQARLRRLLNQLLGRN